MSSVGYATNPEPPERRYVHHCYLCGDEVWEWASGDLGDDACKTDDGYVCGECWPAHQRRKAVMKLKQTVLKDGVIGATTIANAPEHQVMWMSGYTTDFAVDDEGGLWLEAKTVCVTDKKKYSDKVRVCVVDGIAIVDETNVSQGAVTTYAKIPAGSRRVTLLSAEEFDGVLDGD